MFCIHPFLKNHKFGHKLQFCSKILLILKIFMNFLLDKDEVKIT